MSLSIVSVATQVENQCRKAYSEIFKAYNEMSSEDVKRIATDSAIKGVALVMFSAFGIGSQLTVVSALAIGVGSGCAKYAISKLIGENLLTEALAGYISYEVIKCASLTLGIFTSVFAPTYSCWDWEDEGLEAFEVVFPLVLTALMRKVSTEKSPEPEAQVSAKEESQV